MHEFFVGGRLSEEEQVTQYMHGPFSVSETGLVTSVSVTPPPESPLAPGCFHITWPPLHVGFFIFCECLAFWLQPIPLGQV